MNKTESKTSIGQIKLIPNDGALLAIPAEAAVDDESVTPIDVPQVATSLVSWALGLTFVARQKADRCVALLMMLDMDTGQWSLCIPKQTCGIDAACWSTDRRDYPDLPANMRIGGTFQSRAGLSDDEIADAVPPISGVHSGSSMPFHASSGVRALSAE